MEDQPGTVAGICRSLAVRGVNILAFQSCPSEGKSLVRLVGDKPTEGSIGVSHKNSDCVWVTMHTAFSCGPYSIRSTRTRS